MGILRIFVVLIGAAAYYIGGWQLALLAAITVATIFALCHMSGEHNVEDNTPGGPVYLDEIDAK